MSDRTIVGKAELDPEQLEAVVANSKAHEGGYDPIALRIWSDGTVTISTPLVSGLTVTLEPLE